MLSVKKFGYESKPPLSLLGNDRSQGVKWNTSLSMRGEHQDLRPWWTLLSVPAACPSPPFLPPCLSDPFCAKPAPHTPPPPPRTRWCFSACKGGGLGTSHERWLQNFGFPQAQAVASVDEFGASTTDRENPCLERAASFCHSVRGLAEGHLSDPSWDHWATHLTQWWQATWTESWDFLTNTRKVPLNLGKEKLLLPVLCLWLWRTGDCRLYPATLCMTFTKCTVTKNNLPIGNLQVTILVILHMGFLKVATLKL